MNALSFKKICNILFFLITSVSICFSQQKDSTCRVLLKEISGSYKGGCKNGLASGKGTSTGEDVYTGTFLNGLPDGKGVYKYKNGNVFSGLWRNGLKNGKGEFKSRINGTSLITSGFWKDGDYAGKSAPEEEYRVINKSGIENYSIQKIAGNDSTIEISFEKVMRKYIPEDLEITITSGFDINQNKKILIQKYTCPFNCEMRFTIKMAETLRQCNFGFSILKPGKYTVFISNN